MILREEDGDAVVCIGQTSHAWISGQLARAWAGPFTPAEAVCLAAEQHDIGWADRDLAPSLHPETGLPRSFVQMPRQVHVDLWTDAPGRLLSQSAYVALLVSLHGTLLYERWTDPARLSAEDRALVERYLREQASLQRELAAACGADPDELDRNRWLLAAWDAISLALCHGWGPYAVERVPGHGTLVLGADGTLDPWPFRADRVEVLCEGRRLRGRFADEASLRAAFAAAPLVECAFVLTPR